MGSLISLGVGRMEIDWGKNNYFKDHSVLFQPQDVKLIPYHYIDEDGNPFIVEQEGYSSKLKFVKQRLNLLGYTIKSVEEKFNEIKKEHLYHDFEIALSFDTFADMIKTIDVNKINTPALAGEFQDNGYDLGEFARRCIIPEEEFYSKLLEAVGGDVREVDFELETFFENLDPYIILRLLGENESCGDLDVYWSYADVVEGGWVRKEDIVLPLPDTKKILIVTEGSSDAFIIKKTIETFYPKISDFFCFIDMQENYPFTGTGNLYNFCCGLMKINVQNQVIVIFDNDTSGNEKYERLRKLPQMKNLLVTKLPYMSQLESIETIGPQGSTIENINGTAVAIECFLDFTTCKDSPIVRWTSFSEKMGQYQGALMHKDEYIRCFKKNDLVGGQYDVSKLKFLVEYIINQWCDND